MPDTVLVTGGSGFIAAHIILQLLQAGHTVRTTVRSPAREAVVRDMLGAGGLEQTEGRLSFAVADLEKDDGWAEAAQGCGYVMHVASPLPASLLKHEEELIVPAREGTLRVLRAARDAGVKRVVLTSSFAAIGYGHEGRDQPFDETDWTDTTKEISPYVKSKAIAERAAWDFIRREGGALELVAINPVGVMGPVLGPDFSASIQMLQKMMNGSMRFLPDISFGIVDVRDVADLHLRAMAHPAAAGQRFLAVSGDFISLQGIAHVLNIRSLPLPTWIVRLILLLKPGLRATLSELGKHKHGSSAKAKRMLGWTPRPREEAILATASSLRRFRLVG